MKCNYCGKELPQGADFCPECGMIISLDGSNEAEKEVNEVEVPEFTPNVFKAMDFEEEKAEPAMELEADTKEEKAVVVEAIPEYVPEAEVEDGFADEGEEIFIQHEEAPQQAEAAPAEDGFADDIIVASVEDGFASENDGFAPPEYTSELSYLDKKEEAPIAQVLFDADDEEDDDASGDTIIMSLDQLKQAQQELPQDEPVQQAPVKEDNSLLEALFDPSVFEKTSKDEIEDITKAHNDKIKKEKNKTDKKSSNKGYAMVFALVAVLVGIIFAAGYVMDNVLPKIQDNTSTTDANATTSSTTAPSTAKPAETTSTNPGDTTTTKEGETSSTNPGETTSSTGTSTTVPGAMTTTSPTTTAPTTTVPSTTAPTTTAPTTTSPTTTKPTTTAATTVATTAKQPSSWYSQSVVYYPSGSVSIKTSPSSSGTTMGTHAYGYPLWAYASENGYYYVESAYLGVYGWVSSSGLQQYVTTTAPTTTRPTTTRPTTTKPTTTAPTTQPTTQPTTDYDREHVKYEASYKASVNTPNNANLYIRFGPGTDFNNKGKLPYGTAVTVIGYSATVSGWVYVKVDSSGLEGWVSSDYLK